MRFRLPVYAAALALFAAMPAPAGTVFVDNAMNKIGRDAPVGGAFKPVQLEAMRNEHELFQIVFHADEEPIDDASVTIGELESPDGNRIPAEAITLRRAHYIHLAQYVPEPVWLPDALLPYHGEKLIVPPHQNQAIYVDIHVPADTPPGDYLGSIQVTIDGQLKTTTLTIQVRNLLLDDTPTFQSAFAIWNDDQLLAPYPDIRPGSPEARALYEKLYWFMTDYRLPPDDLPVQLNSQEADRFLNHPKVNSFRIPYNPDDPEGFQDVCNLLREKGLLERGYVYTIDEPTPDQYQFCADYAKRIHELAPDVRFLLTVDKGYNDTLKNSIDIWCPILAGYDYDYFTERRKDGNNVWWYTCVWPQKPYPTYLINDDGVSPRILEWMQAKYNVEGNLYWSVNIWRKYNAEKQAYEARDIWNDPAAFPNANGDGYLLYPAEDPTAEPIPTLRLELIRQGNEDFDMLSMLKQATRRAIQAVGIEDYTPEMRVYELVNRIADSMTSYTKDPEALEQLRRDVLDELETLAAGPAAVITASVPEGIVVQDREISWSVYPEAGSTVTVTVEDEGGAETLAPENAEARPLQFRYRPKRRAELAITVEKDGRSADFRRRYRVNPNQDTVLPVLSWAKPEEQLKKFRLDHVKLFPIAGSAMQGFEFLPDIDYAFVRFDIPEDTSPYQWILINLANPGDGTAVGGLNFYGPNGPKYGQNLMVKPHGKASLAFPFNPPGAKPEDAYNELGIWMHQSAVHRKLEVESVSLHTQQPKADNTR
ncbi:DUF4091 domain-containing protein [Victivallis sp. Marseille-Q1083]|uniref:DUF4091 domain-containing protein n=1 Tax=Victivallis sp. Marseille-Q1083 TaxID=2717288 RepID=UPI00158D662A|nr:DUF4091 domain-containing protein [Victivallis sp. Marseille-Q1083]